DALGQRLLAVADPYLEVHRIRPSDEVVGGGSQDPGPLHVLHCPDPPLELTRRAAHEEDGQRQAHAEIADEVHEGLVHSAGLSLAPSQTVHFVCPRIVPSPTREVSISLGRSPDALARRTPDFSHARESQSIGPSSDAGGSVLSPMPPSASLDGKGEAHAMPSVR